MAITVNGCSGASYTFEGPYHSTINLKDRSGVYLIICENNANQNPVDVGESSSIKSRVETHDRKDCWDKNCAKSNLRYAAKYIEYGKKPSRTEIERDIRCNYNFPCGDK